ncbi:MAG TPA: hypothetical protein VME24_12310 [Alphaproteobacteria bacterium]|nr:hypothetical protein [Alphaproteobacteria bacterium]
MNSLKTFALILAATGSGFGAEIMVSSHHPAKEDTYTITLVIQVRDVRRQGKLSFPLEL